MTQNEILDIELLQGYLDSLGDEVVGKMFAIYQQQSQLYLTEIEQSILAPEATVWQQACHKMKGASSSIGLKQVRAYLVDIEKKACPKQEKIHLVEQLTLLNEQGIAAFSQWLTS